MVSHNDAERIIEYLDKMNDDDKICYPIQFKISQKNLENFIRDRKKREYQINTSNTINYLEELINTVASILIPKVVGYYNKGPLYQITWLQDVNLRTSMSHSFYNMNYDDQKKYYTIFIPGHIHKIIYYNSENFHNNFASSSYAGLP
ncbi:MAG: hypothetical protein CMC93_03015 [Flavobacteriaceae bacterium]|nr:hypothetical protein [Flavobacteriaceae bacterium]|tara:strand:- start:121 stop:561 length:441 start_codon:yes stop_codon:yes gene_type:complete